MTVQALSFFSSLPCLLLCFQCLEPIRLLSTPPVHSGTASLMLVSCKKSIAAVILTAGGDGFRSATLPSDCVIATRGHAHSQLNAHRLTAAGGGAGDVEH